MVITDRQLPKQLLNLPKCLFSENEVCRQKVSEKELVKINECIKCKTFIESLEKMSKLEGNIDEKISFLLKQIRTYDRIAKKASRELAEKDEDLDLLYESGKLLSVTWDIEQVCPAILDHATRIVDIRNGVLLLTNEISGELELKAIKGIEPVVFTEIEKQIGDLIFKSVTDSIKPSVFNADIDYKIELSSSDKVIRSIASIPLTVKERCIGIMCLFSTRVGYQFNQDDVELLSTISNQSSIAIENARLYSRLERKVTELSILYNTSDSLRGYLTTEGTLDTTADLLTKYMAIEGACVYIYDKRNNSISDFPSGNADQKTVDKIKNRIQRQVSDISSSKDVQTEELNLIFAGLNSNESKDSVEFELFPLTYDVETIGALVVFNRLGEFTLKKEDRELISMVCSMISQAIITKKFLVNYISMKNYNQLILNSMSDGVITIDMDGDLTLINKSALEILGLEELKTLGKDCIKVFPQKDGLADILMDTINRKGDAKNLEIELTRKNGEQIFVGITSSALVEDGNMIGAIAVFNDLTDIKKFEEQMRQTERMSAVGQLAASVAHEINNPILCISNYIQIMQMEADIPQEQSNYLDLLQKEVKRIASIVGQLSSFSRETEYEMALANVNEIIDSTLLVLKHQISNCRIEVSKDYSSEISWAVCDSSKVQQVFMNILINAIQAMENGGTLNIKTYQKKDRHKKEYLATEFSDTGCGISKKNLPHIFEPFFTTKEQGRGTGLGLSVSYGIINRHNGKIEVKSAEGKGTTFTVLLPVN